MCGESVSVTKGRISVSLYMGAKLEAWSSDSSFYSMQIGLFKGNTGEQLFFFFSSSVLSPGAIDTVSSPKVFKNRFLFCCSLRSLMDTSPLVAQMVNNLTAVQETWIQSLGGEDPLEKVMATHSRILAWIIPQTEEPGWLQSMGSQRVGHYWETNIVGFMDTSQVGFLNKVFYRSVLQTKVLKVGAVYVQGKTYKLLREKLVIMNNLSVVGFTWVCLT